jgi:glycosyltransferase involved in cell wall biosynthesis
MTEEEGWMRILHINKFFFLNGGSEQYMLEVSRLFQERRHEVIPFAIHHPSNRESLWNKYFVSSIDFNVRTNAATAVKTAGRVLYSVEARKKLCAIIKDAKPDVAHIHNFYHQLSPSIFLELKKQGIPAVVTMHDYKLVCPAYLLRRGDQICEDCSGGRFWRASQHRCLKDSLTKSLLATCESYLHHRLFLLEKLRAMGFEKPMVNLPYFCRLEDVSGPDPPYDGSIVYFGRLSTEKGLITLIDAVKDISVTLKLIGTGPLELDLKEKCQREGIKNVVFTGYQKKNELTAEVRSALFCILPSEWYENLPMSILEAFALGKPVIGARIGGIPELVKDNVTGLTFEPRNISDLRKKISFLLSNPDLTEHMGRQARKLVEEEFSAEVHYPRLLSVYQQAIAGR